VCLFLLIIVSLFVPLNVFFSNVLLKGKINSNEQATKNEMNFLQGQFFGKSSFRTLSLSPNTLTHKETKTKKPDGVIPSSTAVWRI
jgi:hypothetical protein